MKKAIAKNLMEQLKLCLAVVETLTENGARDFPQDAPKLPNGDPDMNQIAAQARKALSQAA